MPSTYAQLRNIVYDFLGDPDTLTHSSTTIDSALTGTGAEIARDLKLVEEERDVTVSATTNYAKLTLTANGGLWSGQVITILDAWISLGTNTWTRLMPATDRYRPEAVLSAMPSQFYLIGWDPSMGELTPTAEGCPVLYVIPGSSSSRTVRVRALVLPNPDTSTYDPALPTGAELYHLLVAIQKIKAREDDSQGENLLGAMIESERRRALSCRTPLRG